MKEGKGGKPPEGDHEAKNGLTQAAQVSQLNNLTSKIFEVENKCNNKGRYIDLHTRKSFREHEKIPVEDTLQIIRQNIIAQDRVLDKIRESCALNQVIAFPSRSIQHMR